MEKRYLSVLCNVLLVSAIIFGMPALGAKASPADDHNSAENQKYEAWKEEKKEEWAQYDRKTLADQIWMLLREFPNYLRENDKTQAFYAYNYLRELNNQSLAKDISQIDHNWIAEQDYIVWKEATKEQWTEQGVKSLTQQISNLISTVSLGLRMNYDDEALHAYNYLRELKDQSLAKDISQIDHNWVTEQDYIVWKEEQKEWWTKNGYKSLGQQLYNLAKNIPLDLKSGYNTAALYGYNYLSELLNKPTISDVSKIDQQWLNELTKASDSSAEEQEYSRWKEWKKERWVQNYITDLDQQIADLISHVLYYLEHNDNTEALYAYNYLRELKNQAVATDVSQVDQNWAIEQGYNAWKEKKKEDWSLYNSKTPATQIENLLRSITYHLDQDNKTEALYEYNYVRELLNKPTDLSKIDKQWLNEVTKAADAFVTMKSHKYQPASTSQKALIKEAQAIIGLQKEISIFSTGSESDAFSSPDHIALCDTPDLDQRLATIYHELGHLVHEDSINGEAVDEGQKLPEEFLESPDFKADLARIKQYIDRGSKALDKSTEIGKHINYILKQYPSIRSKNPYWEPPQDKDLYNKQVYARGTEQRADLFMLDELFKQKKITPILKAIDEWIGAIDTTASSNQIINKDPNDIHPSHFERALYTIGFLVAHGENINAELKKWENRGICIDSEKLYQSKTPFSSDRSNEGEGTIDFLRAYQKWQKAHQAEDYQQWKEQLKSESESETIDQGLLKWYYNYYTSMLKTDSFNAFYKREKLYRYNYLRELKNQPLATDLSQIDPNWVAQQ